MKSGFLKVTFCTALFAGLGTVALAQKVNELQEVSIFAPPALKIDGKNLEWKDADFSVNKRTGLSYIISNDDKNLYLIIKSTEVQNNSKILAGGITFSVNPDGKKKEKESIALTYPITVNPFRQGGGRRAMTMTMSMGGARPDPKQRDSAMVARQKTQLATAKEIKLKGFKNTTDTLVSIYNEYSIKAFANIDKDNAFFYEVAIPLEAFGISVDSPKEFAYNIKLNGLQLPGFDGGGFGGGRGGRGGGGGGGNFGGGGGGGGHGGFNFQDMMSPTDFWGKYTLAKK